MNNTFIFTEAYNCGLILKKCLETFFKYHPDTKIHVFGTVKDFEDLGDFENAVYIDSSEDLELKACFERGHLGTAHIFSKVILEHSKGFDYVLHFDSDVIFKKESLSLIDSKIKEGYDLIGPRRCYKHNLNNRSDLGDLEDVSQTYFYAFNKNKISKYDLPTLRSMIVGFYNPLKHPILDFFDPVSFDILKNGGKPFFLDFQKVGAQDSNGNRINSYGDICKDLDFGDNLSHFAGIGSGMKFHINGPGQTPRGYVEWALKRYSLYCKLFYGTDHGLDYDNSQYELLKTYFNETNT